MFNFTKNKVFLSLIVIFCMSLLVFNDLLRANTSLAQELNLPAANVLLAKSSVADLPYLRGLKLDPENPLNVEFVVDTAGVQEPRKEEISKLMNYFLAILTTPSDKLWVNLSPYEQDRIMAEGLDDTDLGKDLLSQDYILKQFASSLTFPETEIGKQYWKNVGTTFMPSCTDFNRIWIVPNKAEVYLKENFVFIADSSLKVQSEIDYLASKQEKMVSDTTSNAKINTILLPEIENEVNNGEHFASLRQIYNTLILAIWFKKRTMNSFYRYYLNENNLSQIELGDKQLKEKIWNLYCESFKSGVYNYIKKEDIYNGSKNSKVKRAYFSGGVGFEHANSAITEVNDPRTSIEDLMVYKAQFKPSNAIQVDILGEIKEELGDYFDRLDKAGIDWNAVIAEVEEIVKKEQKSPKKKKKKKKKDKVSLNSMSRIGFVQYKEINGQKMQRIRPLTGNEQYQVFVAIKNVIDKDLELRKQQHLSNLVVSDVSDKNPLNLDLAQTYLDYGTINLHEELSKILGDDIVYNIDYITLALLFNSGASFNEISPYIGYANEITNDQIKTFNKIRDKLKGLNEKKQQHLAGLFAYKFIGEFYSIIFDGYHYRQDYINYLNQGWKYKDSFGVDFWNKIADTPTIMNVDADFIFTFVGLPKLKNKTLLVNDKFTLEVLNALKRILNVDDSVMFQFADINQNINPNQLLNQIYDFAYLKPDSNSFFNADTYDLIAQKLTDRADIVIDGSIEQAQSSNVVKLGEKLWDLGFRAQLESQKDIIYPHYSKIGGVGSIKAHDFYISGVNLGVENLNRFYSPDESVFNIDSHEISGTRTAQFHTYRPYIDDKILSKLSGSIKDVVAKPVDMWQAGSYKALSTMNRRGTVELPLTQTFTVKDQEYTSLYAYGLNFGVEDIRNSTESIMTKEKAESLFMLAKQLYARGILGAIPLMWGEFTSEGEQGQGFVIFGQNEHSIVANKILDIVSPVGEASLRKFSNMVNPKLTEAEKTQLYNSILEEKLNETELKSIFERLGSNARNLIKEHDVYSVDVAEVFFEDEKSKLLNVRGVDLLQNKTPADFRKFINSFTANNNRVLELPYVAKLRREGNIDCLAFYQSKFLDLDIKDIEFDRLNSVVYEMSQIISRNYNEVYISDNLFLKSLRTLFSVETKRINSFDDSSLYVYTNDLIDFKLSYVKDSEGENLILPIDLYNNLGKKGIELDETFYKNLLDAARLVSNVQDDNFNKTKEKLMDNPIYRILADKQIYLEEYCFDDNAVVYEEMSLQEQNMEEDHVQNLYRLNRMFDATYREFNLKKIVTDSDYEKLVVDTREIKEVFDKIAEQQFDVRDYVYEKSILRLQNVHMKMVECAIKSEKYEEAKEWLEAWYKHFAIVGEKRGVVHAISVCTEQLAQGEINKDIEKLILDVAIGRQDLVSIAIAAIVKIRKGELEQARTMAELILLEGNPQKSHDVVGEHLLDTINAIEKKQISTTFSFDRVINKERYNGLIEKIDSYLQKTIFDSRIKEVNFSKYEDARQLLSKIVKSEQPMSMLEQALNDKSLTNALPMINTDNIAAFKLFDYLSNNDLSREQRQYVGEFMLPNSFLEFQFVYDLALGEHEDIKNYWQLYSICLMVNDKGEALDALVDHFFADNKQVTVLHRMIKDDQRTIENLLSLPVSKAEESFGFSYASFVMELKSEIAEEDIVDFEASMLLASFLRIASDSKAKFDSNKVVNWVRTVEENGSLSSSIRKTGGIDFEGLNIEISSSGIVAELPDVTSTDFAGFKIQILNSKKLDQIQFQTLFEK